MNVGSKFARRRPVAEINVVPYIDVMLVLLVIFMITAPLLSQGVNVDLPQAHAKTLTQEREPIIVSVNAQGEYFLNIASTPEQPMAGQQVLDMVRKELAAGKDLNQKRNIFVKGDKHVSYGAVVEIMALLQQAGAQNIGLMTEDPGNQKVVTTKKS